MVSPNLRKRIDAAVEKLSYVPNIAASRLASTRSHSIGVIVSSLSNGIFAEYLQSIYATLLPLGFHPVIAASRYSDEEEEEAIKALLGQRIEAMILVGVRQTPQARRLLARSRIPVVQTFDLTSDPIDMNVGFSQRGAGVDATRLLIELGHERIHFISGQLDERARARMEGYEMAMKRAGLGTRVRPLSVPIQSSIAVGRRVAAEVLASKELPDAIFCCDDNIALGALFECRHRGLDVPGQVSLMGFNDLEFAAISTPSLSTIVTPRADMGRVASELVLQVIATGRRPSIQRVDLGYQVAARESTGPASRPKPGRQKTN